ncbi:MAG TPA: TetR/AcrR family transcriptional regulator [Microbacteriaceae bacterium]|nr:TetR/AcrR family transcriptional regulator [Microbacteriaceae bacterium]
MTDVSVQLDPGDARAETRARIIAVAASLLQEHGADALTTRAVAQAAGVQAPTIYRIFGDKDGLIEAVSERVLHDYVAAKAEVADAASAADIDPVIDLRHGWDMQVEFGLANPAVFNYLNGAGTRSGSAATAAGIEVLRARVHRVAVAGRLCVTEKLAIELIHAAGTGAVFALLSTASDQRDLQLADALYNAVAREILTDAPAFADNGLLPSAVAFRTLVQDLPTLTDAEKALMAQWLDRAIEEQAREQRRSPR